LWFIGVLRDRLGDYEDRLFSTVFLGSGLMFLAMTFIGAALAGGLLNSYAANPDAVVQSGVFTYGSSVMYHAINVYAIRMAGVFMISLGTIWFRTGLMHRGWAFLTYALALVLLVSIGYSLWVTLIFPAWVLAVSIAFLISNLRHHSEEGMTESDTA
jgi:Na+/phosphate symporter